MTFKHSSHICDYIWKNRACFFSTMTKAHQFMTEGLLLWFKAFNFKAKDLIFDVDSFNFALITLHFEFEDLQ